MKINIIANASTYTIFAILAYVPFFVVLVTSAPIIVKTDDGQIFRCVDFFKQPALRNHLSDWNGSNLTRVQQQQSPSGGLGLGSRRCPIGMVPILENPKLVPNSQIPREPLPPPTPHAKEQCIAKAQLIFNPESIYFGAHGWITLYKPPVLSSQWSSSRIKLLNSGESIEAGWMVNPRAFGDDRTRFYASFTAGGKVCINLKCEGFVQVSTEIPLGVLSRDLSTDKKQFAWIIAIDKREDDGNWWLSISGHRVGYWPKTLFSALADHANQVEFGGEINNPGAINPMPSMGNGMQADDDLSKSACIARAEVVDERFQNVNTMDMETVADCPAFYTVIDSSSDHFARMIFYGGPGSD